MLCDHLDFFQGMKFIMWSLTEEIQHSDDVDAECIFNFYRE